MTTGVNNWRDIGTRNVTLKKLGEYFIIYKGVENRSKH